ncbi:(2Fe-2S) ferredoxin domain-containing protein [Solemya velesiana gill symbiont]|uniref:Ferredoxin n=1 Tax=Solemya velesiana gill symbiont TaxID=1918948 RepID=A0A1T2KSX5_9GAMM|nr:ferredoxin [Solemya velesiana gill symbiont]OOZ35955.1 ferredoxin [Solemya velesiana gill symbiont]
MSYYQRHLFFCVNQREDGEACCQQFNARDAHGYVKERLKSMDLHGAGQVRANKSGCLGRCERGPVLVVYPEAVWYTYVDREDLDEIIDEHLVNGRIVERLMLRES